MTDAEELALYEAAATVILAGGQDVQLGDQRVRYGDLATIQARIDVLRARVARAARGGRLSVAVGTQRR
jgi:hypothetical protein